MRCAECGHETPDAAHDEAAVQVLGAAGWRLSCGNCGAPVSLGRALPAEPPPGGLGASVTEGQPAGQGAGTGTSRRTLYMVGLGVAFVVLFAVLAAVALQSSPAGRQLTEGELRPGDCLTGSNMGLGTSRPWPYQVTAVPCIQGHVAEVFFAGNAWPLSLTKYPGNDAIASRAWDRCLSAFAAYDGIVNLASSFTFDDIVPSGGSDWASGDRLLVCVAHKGTTPVNYSIKGSRQ